MGGVTSVLQTSERIEKQKIRNTNFFDGNSCIVTNPYESNERIRMKSLVVKELEIGYLLKLVKNFLRQVFRNSS